ncbi:MAG: cysteine synthase A [Clostridia bacterium]|nr:cysteine synthase A [Clostridia bacterium]
MIYTSLAQLVGGTPLLALQNLQNELSLQGNLFAKLESFNPAGSVKDRVALQMIRSAEAEGRLTKGGTIIEPTSGNTGIGLAALAAAEGYKMILVMPDTMSIERRRLAAAYGAEVVLSEGALGMNGAIAKAEALQKEISGSMIAGQFVNPANPAAHLATTGPEIVADTEGKVDFFVAGVGTGGTITGVGKYLKEQIPHAQIVAVEPAGSPVLSGGAAGKHGLQGIGAGFVPDVLDRSVIDQIHTVSEQEAYDAARLLAGKEGVLAGISAGAALHAAITLAQKEENKDKNIVVLLPDTGERYLSTDLFV